MILINYSLCFGLPWEKKPALGKRFHDPEKSRQLNGISFADQDRLLFGKPDPDPRQSDGIPQPVRNIWLLDLLCC